MSDEDVINALAQYMPINPLERQKLLELNGPLSRSETLVGLLQTAKGAPRVKIAPATPAPGYEAS